MSIQITICNVSEKARDTLAARVALQARFHEVFSIVTHERIYSPPSASTKALEQINAWLKSPTLVLLSETPGLLGCVGSLNCEI